MLQQGREGTTMCSDCTCKCPYFDDCRHHLLKCEWYTKEVNKAHTSALAMLDYARLIQLARGGLRKSPYD